MEVTINYNGQAVTVEVTLEVYEFLDRAACRAIQPAQHVQQRGFAGAGCADNCNKFALLYT